MGSKPKTAAKPGAGFCHHCKQMKASELLVTCSYDSSVVGNQTPLSSVVQDLTIYNCK